MFLVIKEQYDKVPIDSLPKMLILVLSVAKSITCPLLVYSIPRALTVKTALKYALIKNRTCIVLTIHGKPVECMPLNPLSN